MTTTRTPLDNLKALADIAMGERGTQVTKNGNRSSSGATTLYTVATGYILKISSAWMTLGIIGDGMTYKICWKTGATVNYILIGGSTASTSEDFSTALTFPRAIEIPAGDIVSLECDADCYFHGGFVGWVERAT